MNRESEVTNYVQPNQPTNPTKMGPTYPYAALYQLSGLEETLHQATVSDDQTPVNELVD